VERRWFGSCNAMFDSPEPAGHRTPPEVTLPTADMAGPIPVEVLEHAIRLDVGADGTRFHDGRDITDDFALWLLFRSRRDSPVVIYADESAPVGRVQRIRSRSGHAGTWLAARNGMGLRLPGTPPPTADVLVTARVHPQRFKNGTRSLRDVYRECWRIHQANTGRTIVLNCSFDYRATVSQLTVLLNEAARFGWPISAGLPSADGPATTLYFSIAVPQDTPVEKGEVPELQPGVALGRRPAEPIADPERPEWRYSYGGLLSGRKGYRNLRAEGGSAATWKAMQAGLGWLSGQQAADGSFGGGEEDTARAVLAFLAAGAFVRDDMEKYDDLVDAGLSWLEKHQASSGPATTAFAEAYGLTGESRWLRAAEEAAKKTRSGLALRIARLCDVPVTIPDAKVGGDAPAACLVRILDGTRPWQDEELDRAMRRFTEPVEDDPLKLTGMDRGLLHDATLAVYQAGGAAWMHWLRAMKQALLGTQVTSGPEAGSWPRSEGASQIRDTALNVATLTVFFRYARLFKR
jgi:hypothetical protein